MLYNQIKDIGFLYFTILYLTILYAMLLVTSHKHALYTIKV